MNRILQKEKYELAEKEYANSCKGIRELSKQYNIDRQVFTGWLLAKDYDIYNRRASKSFNVCYFDNIDTEEKAYWLGFLFADGAITKYNTSYDIEFSLKKDDAEHVQKYANAIEKYKISKSNYRARCIVGSKHMFETLEKYGCTRKKSLTLKFPDLNIFFKKDLIKHFIRGYIDGDGCISYINKEHTKMCVSILGTENFLNGIQTYLNTNYKLSLNNKNQNVTKVLTFTGKNAYNILKYLYKDATIYLERKYKRYCELCRLFEESNKSLSSKIGEVCNDNTEVNSEITKGSESPYSVESE